MSPFAETPHLWLTNHLERQKQNEHVIKIQAVAKGFLVRRRQSQRINAALPAVSLHDFMMCNGLRVWAEMCPDAKEACLNEVAAKKRQECISNAKITLRLLNKADSILHLEWAEYHERCQAFHELYDVGSPIESLWQKFKKTVGI
jgi:hypothetical protein